VHESLGEFGALLGRAAYAPVLMNERKEMSEFLSGYFV